MKTQGIRYPGADTVVLQSADDTLHPVSRSFLARHSSFFADLPPFLRSEEAGHPILPLPSSTSAGLAVVIRLLPLVPTPENRYDRPWLNRPARDRPLREIGLEDLGIVEDAILIARTYEMDTLLKEMGDLGYMERLDRPLFSWALTVLVSSDYNHEEAIMATLRPAESLPETAREILERADPEQLERFIAVRAEWTEVTRVLRQALLSGEPAADWSDAKVRGTKSKPERSFCHFAGVGRDG